MDQNLTILEHLRIFQRTIFAVVGIILTASVVVHTWRDPIVRFILEPLGQNSPPLQFLSPLDPLFFILKLDFTLGILITLPITLFLIWRFISPETGPRGILRPVIFIGAASTLGLMAAYYSYDIIVPIVLNYMQSIVIEGTTTAFTAQGYLNFLLSIVTIMVFVFQLPLVIFTLAWAQILDPRFIAAQRRYIYAGTFIAVAFITPTTDVITLFMVALPTLAVIELGTVAGRLVYRVKKQQT